MDYDKTSDFDDVSGHWHLEDHPDKPGCTRVFYACDVMLRGAIPKPIVNYLSNSALKTATGWVKKECEKALGTADDDSTVSTSSSSTMEESGKPPSSITFTKDDIRALASGKPVQTIVTLHLNRGEMSTLRKKRQLSKQATADDGDSRATISALQVIEAPKLPLVERFKDSLSLGLIIAALIIGLSSLL